MRRLLRPCLFLLTAVAVVALSAPRAAAESTAFLVNGQRISGVVPKGEVIRLRFRAAAGTEPRLTLSLAGSKVAPLSFLNLQIVDPDGAVVPDTSQFFLGTRLRLGKSKLKLRGFVAQKTGDYTLLTDTNSARLPGIAELRATGRFKLKRPKRAKTTLTEANLSLDVALLFRDQVIVKVKSTEGGIPVITRFVAPRQEFRFPATERRRNKKGAVSQNFRSIDDDDHTFEFGYRGGQTTGTFEATVRVNMFTLSTVAFLRIENAPGIPLSVRPADRFRRIEWGVGAPGLAYDAGTNSILVTALYLGGGAPQISGRLYDTDLFEQPGTPQPVPFVGPADMQPGEQLGTHRIVATDVNYYIAWATQSGLFAGFSRIRKSDLGREGFLEAIANATTPVRDHFLVTNGDQVSLGVFRSPDGHDVHVYEADLTGALTIAIGGGAFSHANGAGAVWNLGTDTYQLWAPDALGFGLASDLNRQNYSEFWQVQGSNEKPIADPQVMETMSTGVSLDLFSGVTIVHYVVPENPDGRGTVVRSLFDDAGDFILGSDVALPTSGLNRPTSIVVGNFVYVGYSSAAGPAVERFPLLRSQ